MRVIDSLGLDDKGKRKKLEGNTLTFSLRCSSEVVLPQFPCRSGGALWRDGDCSSDIR
jgi:hypothetical protein